MLETEISPNDSKWYSDIEAAQIVSNPDVINWNDEADLVVVGLGGAGIAAANEALDQGYSVIGLDKTSGGGATARSGGIFYAGGGTPIQKEAGVEDSVENMFNYLIQETGDIVKESTLKKFCETSAENTQWLMDNGVQFNSKYYQTKTSYPGAGYFLYHSDNSLVPSYMKKASPAPRGHRGYEDGPFKPIGVGGTIFYPLKKSAMSKGLKIFSQTEARSLVISTEGRVLGIKALMLPSGKIAEKHKKLMTKAETFQMLIPQNMPGAFIPQFIGKIYIKRAQKIESNYREVIHIKANKGVCLSTGGFIFNREMIQENAPKYIDGMPLGTSHDTGSGIRLGQTVGGKTDYMNRVTAWRMLNPPMAFARGLVVNKNGVRFGNEMVYGATLGDAMCEDHEGKAIELADQAAKRGMIVHAVGVGTSNGSLIPIIDKQGIRDYKRDAEGKLITSLLNEKILNNIAEAGNGTYVRFDNKPANFKKITNAIDNMEKRTLKSQIFSEYEDRYQSFAIISFGLMFIGLIIPTKVKKYKKWKNRFEN